jgi:hypothetical protein
MTGAWRLHLAARAVDLLSAAVERPKPRLPRDGHANALAN